MPKNALLCAVSTVALLSIATFTGAAAQTGAPAAPAAATTDKAGQKRPVLFTADRLRNEQKVGVIVATGNVEFTQDNRTLLADTVTYNRRTDIVVATGNVSLLEPTGEVIFADRAELTGDMRSGIVKSIRVRLVDDARIAAAGARRTGGNRTDFRKAVYSPCKLCEEDPTRAPIWQMKAIEITHDQAEQEIIYKDAYMEFFGVPVLYTPYLSHADPTVDRRTGFLVPSYGSDSDLGTMIHVPYYIDIAPNMDATVTPIFTGNEGVVLTSEFRHRLNKGEYIIDTSATFGSAQDGGDDEFRGHVQGEFRYDIDETWRGGSDIYLSSDDTYLKRYGLGSEDTLENRLFVEGFRSRHYASANAYFFQGQRATDVQGDTPIILPMLDYNYVGQPSRFGSQWKFDANLLSLTRTAGTSSYRTSLKPQWELPYTAPAGDVYRLFASLQADAYLVNDVEEPDAPDNTISGVTGRFFPQVGADWRLPLARKTGTITQIIKPIVGIVAAPKSQNFEDIPNEDSLSFEFDETNLMAANRYTGLDRVEGGVRINYALEGSVSGVHGGSSSFYIGQSYRLTDHTEFGAGTGLEDHLSDIVGRVRIEPLDYLDMVYRFRLDKDDFSASRNELAVTAGVPIFEVSANYLSVNQQDLQDVTDAEDNFEDREEITLSFTSEFAEFWTGGLSTQRNLEENGGTLNHGAFLQYQDDCFTFRLSVSRSFTRDRDIEPSETIFFQIALKTLGEFQTSTGTDFIN